MVKMRVLGKGKEWEYGLVLVCAIATTKAWL
jgi:hypothetical protein